MFASECQKELPKSIKVLSQKEPSTISCCTQKAGPVKSGTASWFCLGERNSTSWDDSLAPGKTMEFSIKK